MKAHWGSGGIAPRILDLSTSWRWMISSTLRPLYPQGNSPWCPLDRRLGGSQSRSERGGEEINSQPLSGLKPPNIWVRSPEIYHWAILAPNACCTERIKISYCVTRHFKFLTTATLYSVNLTFIYSFLDAVSPTEIKARWMIWKEDNGWRIAMEGEEVLPRS
jgi:hypothetical protein